MSITEYQKKWKGDNKVKIQEYKRVYYIKRYIEKYKNYITWDSSQEAHEVTKAKIFEVRKKIIEDKGGLYNKRRRIFINETVEEKKARKCRYVSEWRNRNPEKTKMFAIKHRNSAKSKSIANEKAKIKSRDKFIEKYKNDITWDISQEDYKATKQKISEIKRQERARCNAEVCRLNYIKHKEKRLQYQKEYQKSKPKKFSLLNRIKILEDFIYKNNLSDVYSINYNISEEELIDLRFRVKNELLKRRKDKKIEKEKKLLNNKVKLDNWDEYLKSQKEIYIPITKTKPISLSRNNKQKLPTNINYAMDNKEYLKYYNRMLKEWTPIKWEKIKTVEDRDKRELKYKALNDKYKYEKLTLQINKLKPKTIFQKILWFFKF